MKKPLINAKTARSLIARNGSPLYVYRKSVITARYHNIVRAIPHRKTQVFYACKTNSNIEVLRHLKRLGASIECVSRNEIERALRAGFRPQQISYTCSYITRDELLWVMKKRVHVHLDSLTQLTEWGRALPGSRVSLRINRGFGAGGHKHLITGGPQSKFGIYYTDLAEARAIAKRYRLTIVGLQQHIGTHILDGNTFIQAMKLLLHTAKHIPDLEFLNFGGGFGIPYRPDDRPLNMKALGRRMSTLFQDFCKTYGRDLEMRFEPGRYIVAESGALIATVTDVKRTPGHVFVGVDSGMNHLIRPALYGAYHEIFNLSRPNAKKVRADVVGNICESGDTFARGRPIPMAQIGDILLFADAGAHGYVMSSDYNLRKKPKEIVIP